MLQTIAGIGILAVAFTFGYSQWKLLCLYNQLGREIDEFEGIEPYDDPRGWPKILLVEFGGPLAIVIGPFFFALLMIMWLAL